jgi:histidine ammonia-lyase
MVQIAAASLVAESRALAMPASIGSIPTDANQEDFVPMGMAAAFKAGRKVWITANNKAEGSAPLSLLKLAQEIAKLVA